MKSLYDSILKIAESFIMWIQLIQIMIKEGKNLSSLVTISDGNIKTGKIKSVSMLPFITCHKRCLKTCGQKCYAKKICLLRPSVMTSYARNTAIARLAINAYFEAIDKASKNSMFFRFHVSGDIMNRKYFAYMVKTAINNPHCKYLCFTKQYEIVNEWIDKNGKFPENLQVLFSEWINLKSINPHNLPITQVYEKDSDINPDWKLCGGNCLDCACSGCGCWQAKNGETIAFKIH